MSYGTDDMAAAALGGPEPVLGQQQWAERAKQLPKHDGATGYQ